MQCGFENCDRDVWARGYCSKHYYFAQRHGLLPRPQCSVEGCDHPAFRGGLCNRHELRRRRNGNPLVAKKAANGANTGQTCIIAGCERPRQARGLCGVHHGRLRRHGDPLASPTRLGNGQASEERKRENARRALKAYNQTPAGKLRRRYANAKRRALKGGGTSVFEADAIKTIMSGDICRICGEQVDEADKTIDHVIPLSRGGDNRASNMQLAHRRCNRLKSNSV